MRNLLGLILLVFAFAAFSADTYVCPMHCEGQKTYAAPGKCPVCGMDLEKTGVPAAPPLNSREYRVDTVSVPAMPVSGKAAQFVLSPRFTRDGALVKNLEKVALSVVSQDLSWRGQARPEVQTDGSIKTDITFPAGGNYIIYAVFTPKGAQQQVFPLAIQVEGKKKSEVPLKEGQSDKKPSGGYKVKLKTKPPLKTGENVLIFQVGSKDILSPKCVAISEDTTQYLAVDGTMSGTDISCGEHLHRPGLYKIWLEFSHQGKPQVADFTLRVQ